MDLNQIWFALIAVLYAGFFFLEGFDFGVGLLMPFLGKDDTERRVLLNTIGPHWDANEVWLITAAGATFAAFPQWYATMFSGFYPLLLLLLLGLIARGVGIEFRGRRSGATWRAAWDAAIWFGSFLPVMIFGIIFANLIRGVPIDNRMTFAGNFIDLFQPFAMASGFVVVLVFLVHGANFLCLKLEGELQERARKAARRLWVGMSLCVVVFLVSTLSMLAGDQRLGLGAIGAAMGISLGALFVGYNLYRSRAGWAFAWGGMSVVLLAAMFFLALYPQVMVSSMQPDFSLTIYNASSSDYTLRVMSVVALIFVPVMIAYQAWSYWVFRRRIKTDSKELVY